MNITRALLVTSILSLALAAPAGAATPIAIGGGHPADIAVDAAGTAHLAFHTQNQNPEPAIYCQLPRGGASCINQELFVPTLPANGVPSDIFDRVQVFLTETPGEVLVFQDRCCDNTPGTIDKTYVHRSADGGQAFLPPGLPIGSFNDGSVAEAAYGPANSITAITEVTTAGVFVQSADFGGAQETAQAELNSDSSDQAAIGFEPTNGRPVVVYEEQGPDGLNSRAFKDSVAISSATINNANNWDAAQQIVPDYNLQRPALASGPTGLFLIFEISSPNNDRLFVSKFNGTGFGAPVQISEPAGINDVDMSQDAAGRLHAIWHNNTEDSLRYSFSDDGVNWSAPGDISRGQDHSSVRVAAAPDHLGFAVWSNTSGEGNLQAVPLELLPPVNIPGGPDITNPGISDKTLLPGQGANFTFTSNEAGNAVLTFEKQFKGKKGKKKGKKVCKKVSNRKFKKLKKKKRCKAFKKIGEIRQPVVAGQNTIPFTGRIAGKKLSKGNYRAKLVITDFAGEVSRTEIIKFKVIAKKKPKKKRRR